MPQPRKRESAEDGAKPGSQPPPNPKHEFNADSRAADREAAPITVGKREFRRRRKNWKVTRELRSLMRDQELAGLRQSRISKEIEGLASDAEDYESQVIERRAKLDALGDEADEAAYKIIALLLRDEDGESPPLELLQDECDVEDVGELAATLAGGGDELPDPTETASS